MISRTSFEGLAVFAMIATLGAGCLTESDSDEEGTLSSTEAQRISGAKLEGNFNSSLGDITLDVVNTYQFCDDGTFLFKSLSRGGSENVFTETDWASNRLYDDRGSWSITDGEVRVVQPGDNMTKRNFPLDGFMSGSFVVGETLYTVSWDASVCDLTGRSPGTTDPGTDPGTDPVTDPGEFL